MSRNRFDEILSFLHLSNNETLDSSYSMAKVRPVFLQISEKCLQYFLNEEISALTNLCYLIMEGTAANNASWGSQSGWV